MRVFAGHTSEGRKRLRARAGTRFLFSITRTPASLTRRGTSHSGGREHPTRPVTARARRSGSTTGIPFMHWHKHTAWPSGLFARVWRSTCTRRLVRNRSIKTPAHHAHAQTTNRACGSHDRDFALALTR